MTKLRPLSMIAAGGALALALPAFADLWSTGHEGEAIEDVSAPADPPKAGLALYNANVFLCEEASRDPAAFDNADELMNYGFEPGLDADEAELSRDDVEGELITRTIGDTEIRIAHFAPATCVSYIEGPERQAAWDYFRDALIDRHGFEYVSIDAATMTETLEYPMADGRILRYRYTAADGDVPLGTVISTIEDE